MESSMKKIHVHMSPKQIARLRNGHMVLLKKPVEGQGVGIIVDPGTWSLLSKTFDKGRGARVRLSPNEISASIEGGGLKTSRNISKKIAKEVFENPTQVSSAQLTNAGGPHARLTPDSIHGVMEQSKLFKLMNTHLGTNFGAQQKASVGNAAASLASAGYDTSMIDDRKSDQTFGTGLYAGRREGGSLGLNGGFVHHVPPALLSQPYATNFQFSHTLPVAYQRFSGR